MQHHGRGAATNERVAVTDSRRPAPGELLPLMLASGGLPAWQGVALLLGSLLLMVPDGLELVSLAGCAGLAVAMIPTGVELLAG